MKLNAVRLKRKLTGLLIASLLSACHFEYQHPLSTTHIGRCPVDLNGKWEQEMNGKGEGPTQFEVKISPDCRITQLEFTKTKKEKIIFELIFTQIGKKFYASVKTTDHINEHRRYLLFQYANVTPTHFSLYFLSDKETLKQALLQKQVEGYLDSEDKPVVTAKGEKLRNFVANHDPALLDGPLLYRKVTRWSARGRHYRNQENRNSKP